MLRCIDGVEGRSIFGGPGYMERCSRFVVWGIDTLLKGGRGAKTDREAVWSSWPLER